MCLKRTSKMRKKGCFTLHTRLFYMGKRLYVPLNVILNLINMLELNYLKS